MDQKGVDERKNQKGVRLLHFQQGGKTEKPEREWKRKKEKPEREWKRKKERETREKERKNRDSSNGKERKRDQIE